LINYSKKVFFSADSFSLFLMRRRISRSRSPSPSRQNTSSTPIILAKRIFTKAIMARIAIAGLCLLFAVLCVQYAISDSHEVHPGAPEVPAKAVAVLSGNSTVKGVVRFEVQNDGKALHIFGEITGLKPGKHGFHVHVYGDLTNGCVSAGDHFNPSKNTHGAKEDTVRHEGDLGNIEADENGKATVDLTDSHLALTGVDNILGRALVVHEKVDDLGKGGDQESKKTGNAGGRLACGVIGLAKTA